MRINNPKACSFWLNYTRILNFCLEYVLPTNSSHINYKLFLAVYLHQLICLIHTRRYCAYFYVKLDSLELKSTFVSLRIWFVEQLFVVEGDDEDYLVGGDGARKRRNYLVQFHVWIGLFTFTCSFVYYFNLKCWSMMWSGFEGLGKITSTYI